MMYNKCKGLLLFLLLGASFFVRADEIRVEQRAYRVPVLTNRPHNAIVRVKIEAPKEGMTLSRLRVSTDGTTDEMDIQRAGFYAYGRDSLPGNMEQITGARFAETAEIDDVLAFEGSYSLQKGDNFFWLSYTLKEDAPLVNRVAGQLIDVRIDGQDIAVQLPKAQVRQRLAVALRKHNQNGVHTSRIPGIARTKNGTLLAIFDARYESARDLQGHMDIGLHRSDDAGQTWKPMQVAMDMGTWGGLPQKFNGVSDACILVDSLRGTIYIAATWMHGVLDGKGQWVENLQDTSTVWNHQWRDKGSQPGFDVKQTAQFMLVKSTDDGKTWSKPINITKMGKQPDWWLWAPAPGNGVTLPDGTLVFPSQGRDEQGEPFSNITYSKDGGETWKASPKAIDVPGGTTECAVVALPDGQLMLNMRANKNRGNAGPDNGRAISVTADMGATWTEHPTSFKALREPTCMASLYRHGDILLFTNPNHTAKRIHMTLKASLDDGSSWPEELQILLDEGNSRGYSCITTVDKDHIGVLYESSQADMVFQKFALSDIMEAMDNK